MKKTWVKILAAALAAALIAAAVAIVFDIKGSKRPEAKEYEHNINYFYADEEGVTRFLVDSEMLEDRIPGHVDSFISCDGTVGIVRAGTGLFRVDREGVVKIYPAGVLRALLSLDGQKIVFTTATEVHIYDHADGQLEDIKPEAAASIASIVISPDGRTVGYSVKNATGEHTAFAHTAGESRVLGENAYITAIGDDAGFWYYVEPDSVALCYAKGKKVKRIGEGVSGQLEFNRDLTEVTFDMNGTTYYSVKGSSAKPIVKDESVFAAMAACESMQGGESCRSAVKDCSSVFGGVYYSFKTSSTDPNARKIYSLWYVDSNRRAALLANGAYGFSLTKDGGRLSVLMADNVLYMMQANDPKTAQTVSKNVYSYNMSRDGGRFYCLGYDLGLYYIEGSAPAVQLAKNTVYTVLAGEDKCLFLADYDSTGKLIYADGDRPLKGVSDGVSHVEAMPAAYLYYTDLYTDTFGNKVYDVYVSANGVDYELALKGALMTSGEE